MRGPCGLMLLALTACSSQPPSGPSPSPQPTPTPVATRPLPFRGGYELSVSVAAECAREFPVAMRVRRWHVVVLDAGDRSELDFVDPDVADAVNGPGFSSEAVVGASGEARLFLSFAELLGYSRGDRGEPLIFWLEAVSSDGDDFVPIRGAGLEGHILGRVSYDAGPGTRVECHSERHDFYLRPR
jgi:hypothetical protein